MTRTDADRFIDLYLGISSVQFGPEHAAEAGATFGTSTQGPISYADLLRFSQTHLNHRVAELAPIAREVSPIPEFHFFCSNAGTFDAQAVRDLDLPIVRMDNSLQTFWLLICCCLVWIQFGASDHAERLQLREMAWSTIRGYCRHRTLPETDKPLFKQWFRRDEHLAGVAHALATVITFYVILHEMMHLSAPPSLTGNELEFEMDRQAAQALVLVRERGDLQWATIPNGCMGAPVVFFEIQRLIWLERGQKAAAMDRHPHPRSRRRRLERYVHCVQASDRALHRDLRFATAWLAAGHHRPAP